MSKPLSKPIAYLTATFPALSHTFILREIICLESQGLEILPVSVRKPAPGEVLGEAEQAMRARTRYLLAEAKNPLRLLAAQLRALRSPGRYFGALGLAWGTRPAGLRALLYQLIYFAEATLLADHVRRADAGHIHNHFANSSGTVAMLAARLAGVPFSFTLHGPSDLFDARHWRLDRKIAEAEFVACISHFARSQAMLNSDPAHWHKLRIVHCGVEPGNYSPVARAPDSQTRLVFVGRLAPVKGLRILLSALETALETRPDLHLTIVGDGPDRATLERLAAPLGAAVTFAGPQSQAEVAQTLAHSDVMVLPSFAEGVPVVLMEALASGLPVIATRVAGVAELVEDGRSGLLVAPGDATGLTGAILALAADPNRRVEMGVAGRKKVAAEFDIAKEAAWLATIFRGEAGDALRPEGPAT